MQHSCLEIRLPQVGWRFFPSSTRVTMTYTRKNTALCSFLTEQTYNKSVFSWYFLNTPPILTYENIKKTQNIVHNLLIPRRNPPISTYSLFPKKLYNAQLFFFAEIAKRKRPHQNICFDAVSLQNFHFLLSRSRLPPLKEGMDYLFCPFSTRSVGRWKRKYSS